MCELYQSEKEIEVEVWSKLAGMSSIPVLIWVFINRKKIAAKLALSSENATPQQKTLLEEKYQAHLDIKIAACDIKASQELLSQNNPQSIACLAFD